MLLIVLLVKNVFASGNKTIDCTKYDYAYFAIPDILRMLVCYNHTKHIVNCPPKQLYVPGYPHCTSGEKYKNNQNDLCSARKKKSGNIQNPWDCHSFLTCVHGISTGKRPCQDKSLVYNPYKDQCQYSHQYTCRQI